MASGYEKMDCGVTDPNLGWGTAEPSRVADALWMVLAIAAGALNLWGMFLSIRFVLGF